MSQLRDLNLRALGHSCWVELSMLQSQPQSVQLSGAHADGIATWGSTERCRHDLREQIAQTTASSCDGRINGIGWATICQTLMLET